MKRVSDRMSSSSHPSWICSQIGAREHFAIPRALRKAQRTVALYTDFWAGSAVRKLAFGKFRSLAMRCHPELAIEQNSKVNGRQFSVNSWNGRSVVWEYILRRGVAGPTPYHGFAEVGRRFATCVRTALDHRSDLKSGSVFFAYDTGALETLEWCRERGLKCILNQMDPSRVEVELVQEEEKRWPGWTIQNLQVPEEYFHRREQEWSLADRVVVNSEFSRQALLKQGVPAEKLTVIPLCFETGLTNPQFAARQPQPSAAVPLRVLFLGQVILRKGVQYLLAAARQLECEPIHFDIVGPIGISNKAMAAAPSNVTFHGRTHRDQAAEWYKKSHVFVLPTLSDGFAITQLEAMAHGLPVVATSCCGEVVSDGVDGFVVPASQPEALAQVFQRYLSQPDLLTVHGQAALKKAGQFTLDRLAENLIGLESSLLPCQKLPVASLNSKVNLAAN